MTLFSGYLIGSDIRIQWDIQVILIHILYDLVGGLEHLSFCHRYIYIYIMGIFIPIDFHIFQRGWNHQWYIQGGRWRVSNMTIGRETGKSWLTTNGRKRVQILPRTYGDPTVMGFTLWQSSVVVWNSCLYTIYIYIYSLNYTIICYL